MGPTRGGLPEDTLDLRVFRIMVGSGPELEVGSQFSIPAYVQGEEAPDRHAGQSALKRSLERNGRVPAAREP
jgi:hypothetical protein